MQYLFYALVLPNTLQPAMRLFNSCRKCFSVSEEKSN